MFNRTAKITASFVVLTFGLVLSQIALPTISAIATKESFFSRFDDNGGNIFGFLLFKTGNNRNKIEKSKVNAPVACAQPPANLAAWYRAEDNAHDAISLRHGTLENGAQFTTAANGRVGKAFQFGGDFLNHTVLLPRTNFGNNYTVEFWIAPNTTNTGSRAVVGNDFSQNQRFGTLRSNGNKLEYWHNSQRRIETPAGSLPSDNQTWTHVALTYDGAAARLYVNGAISGAPYATTTMALDNELRLAGAMANDFSTFAGRMDEVSIYSAVLSDAQIAAISDAGADGKCDTALRIVPKNRTIAPNQNLNFSVVNGTAPFSYGIVVNNSGATINQTTGAYTAGANPAADVVRVTDANGAFEEATVNVAVPPCQPGQKIWTGGGGSENWSEAANWNCNQAPANGDLIVFDDAGTKNSTIDTSRTINRLQITPRYTGTITQGANSNLLFTQVSEFSSFAQAGGTFQCSAANLTFQAATFTQTGGAFDCAAGSAVTFEGSGVSLNLNGGTFGAPAGNLLLRGLNFNLGGAAVFNHNNGTVIFDGYSGAFGSADALTLNVNGANAGTLELFNASFNNTRAGGSTIIAENDTIRVFNTTNLIDGDINHTNPNNPGSGVVQAEGAVNISQTYGNADNSGTTGSATLRIVGSQARTVSIPSDLPGGFNFVHLNAPNTLVTTSGAGTVRLLPFRLEAGAMDTGNASAFVIDSSFSGAANTAAQTGGAFTCGAGAFTLFRSILTQTGGAFDCAAASGFASTLSQINVNGGTFTAPATTLRLDGVMSGQTYSLRVGGGTFLHNNGTINFDKGAVSGASSCCAGIEINGSNAGTIDFFNVNFDNTESSVSFIGSGGDTLRVLGTLNFVNGFVRPGSGLANPRTTIEAHGNVNVAATFDATSGFPEPDLTFAGANNQTFVNNGAPNLTGNWTINKSAGTLNLASNLDLSGSPRFDLINGAVALAAGRTVNFGAANFSSNFTANQQGGAFVCGSGSTVRFNAAVFNQTGGNFDCRNGLVNVNRSQILIGGGTFDAPAGSTVFDVFNGVGSSLEVISPGIFNHNNGTVVTKNITAFGSGSGTGMPPERDVQTITLFNLQVEAQTAVQFKDTVRVLGAFNIEDDNINKSGQITGALESNWELHGDFNISSNVVAGSNNFITFAGSANQIFSNNGGALPSARWRIAKPGGRVTAATSFIVSASNPADNPLEITSGTFFLNNNSNLTIGALTVGANGRLVSDSATTITLGGNVSNAGIIDLQGGGAACPQNDSILIRSTNTTQRTWSGNGRYRLVDVDVERMGGTGTKTVFSGTNSGNNNTSWVFDANCPAELSITPTTVSLQTGATQTFAAGGGFAPYTFSILTNNSGGSINSTTGVYSAGQATGVTDTVRVTDAFGATADAAVNVFGAPNKLAFTAQPSNAVAGQAIAPEIKVTVQDAGGFTVSNSTVPITLSIANNPNGGGTLSGTVTRNAVNGVATFNDLSIARAAVGYALRAASPNLTDATSSAFNVAPAAPAQLFYVTQPTNANVNTAIAPAVRVGLQDQFGNASPAANVPITVALGSNPSSGTLSGTLTQPTAANGTATFNDLSINNAGDNYTLAASSSLFPGSDAVFSAPFNVGNPFEVSNTNDAGAGSLRQAIINANNAPGAQTISFNISGAAPHSIAPVTPLPNVTDAVTIDGTTQPGFSGAPIVELRGPGSETNVDGLVLAGGNSTVKGLIINRFSAGVRVQSNANTIQGNYIGTNAAGNAAQGNVIGISVSTGNNLIGGATAATRNVISGNRNFAIVIGGSNASANLVQGNFIGTNAAGNAAVPNSSGVFVNTGGNVIGGASAGTRNVISGNGATGVLLVSQQQNQVLGNFIGTDLNGTAAIPNGTGLLVDGSNQKIGGTALGESNVIAFNNFNGVALQRFLGTSPKEKNVIRGNSIHSNSQLGIDLSNDGTTLNDSQDVDAGANNLQNNPVITSALSSGGVTAISGTLNSRPSQTFTLDFYSNAACDALNFNEGETYLGSTQATTDGSGIAGFTANLPVNVPPGRIITATATDAQGNTSEFSQCSRPVGTALLSISGRITDTSGNPVPSVFIQTSDPQIAARTDSNGNYRFDNLPGGLTYTLTPRRANTTFSPANLIFSNLSANQTNQNFTGTALSNIRGKIQSSSNGALFGLSGVTVTLGGAANRTVVTDSNGVYSFDNIPQGGYTVTPQHENFNFSPSSANVALGSATQTIDFTAAAIDATAGRIAFIDSSGISVMNPDGSAKIQPITNLSGCGKPELSRDGGRIVAACSGTRSGSNSNFIVTMSFDGKNQQIVKNNALHSNPAWSPDGSKIAFVEGSTTANSLRVMNADGNNIVSLHSGRLNGNISWSPNGEKIAFSKVVNGNSQIFVVNSDGSNPVQLTANGSNHLPKWSPDGTKIAFIKAVPGNFILTGNIFLMNPDGSAQNQITFDSVFRDVEWSPDGSKLAFLRNTGPNFGMMNGDGTNRVIVTSASTPTRSQYGISWQRTFSQPTPTGANVTISAGAAAVTFGGVSTAGATTVVPIPPGSAGTAPGGFIIANQAYEITTTAIVSPPITVCFNVPANVAGQNQASFNLLSILHNENGVLIDRTASRNFATRTICALTNSLSPFVLAEQIDPNSPRISGLVVDANGNPIVGAAVNLTGAETRSTITDSDGAFSFVNLTAGENYNVQPKQVGYLFTEYSQNFVNLTGEQTAAFVGTAADFQISGRVINENGNPLSGVTVQLDGSAQAAVETDANGNYVFANLPADGFYTITPLSGANAFAPSQIVIDPLTANVGGVDFQALVPAALLSVGGSVSYGITPVGQNVKFVPQVSLSATGGSVASAVTDVTGAYEINDLIAGNNYTIAASKSGDANGISSFDATLVLRCVAAGTGCALTANQKLAANANNSFDGGEPTISAFDATLILRFVAAGASSSAFGEVGKWRFKNSPRSYEPLNASLTSENYEAILIGDVNGNWTHQP